MSYLPSMPHDTAGSASRIRRYRRSAALVWVVPVAAVTAASLKKGRMVDVPRPTVVRRRCRRS
ncbi:hypothetical protein [Kribbella catacumbae]|uniref:hypothetical protein n=1 Tax=Kribbella catacumbae TaxID=460086 RepID=UPI0012FA88DD|nr:hypothetical protein [Kribbella catacumbae]